MDSQAATPSDALADLRVLDMTEGVAGPYATSLLGDMGADVIKVERPDGEWGRSAGYPLEEDFSAMYVAMNRNKRSVGLDLKQQTARDVARELVASADVVVANYRPGVMERVGLGYEECRAIKPNIVYCTITAFDPLGPYATLPGNDTGLQAASGLMSLIGEADGDPLRAGVPVIDMATALFVTQAILIALRCPDQSPSGRRVEISLINVAAALQALPFTEYLNTGVVPTRHGNQNAYLSPAGAFAGADGKYLTIACLKESHWRNLCDVIERPELATDPLFVDNGTRIENRAALNAVLRPIFSARSAGEWLTLLRDSNVLCASVNDLDDVMADPGLGPTLPIVDVDLSTSVRTMGNPVRFGGEFPGVRRGPTRRGEHTMQILEQHGYAPDDIKTMIEEGSVFGH